RLATTIPSTPPARGRPAQDPTRGSFSPHPAAIRPRNTVPRRACYDQAPMKRWLTLGLLCGCGGLQALYPARPAATAGTAIADPSPSRVVVHATLSSAALRRALDEQI